MVRKESLENLLWKSMWCWKTFFSRKVRSKKKLGGRQNSESKPKRKVHQKTPSDTAMKKARNTMLKYKEERNIGSKPCVFKTTWVLYLY